MKKPNDNMVTAAKIIAGVAGTLTIAANITGCVYGPQGYVRVTTSETPNQETATTVNSETVVEKTDESY